MRTSVEKSHSPRDERKPLSPQMQATLGTHVWGDFAGGTAADIEDVESDLKSRAAAVHAGDLKPVEAALLGQADTLAMIFTNLHLRAWKSNDPETMRTLLSLALKAQSQSRATLETLVEAKRPRQLLITRQANVAQNQMVNNYGVSGDGGPPRAEPARTGANGDSPIELLQEGPHANSLDAGEESTPVGIDPRGAAMDAVDRAKDTRGQGRRVKKRVQGWTTSPDSGVVEGCQARDRGRP